MDMYNNHYIVSEGVIALMVLVYFMLAIVGFMTVVVSFIANWKLFEKWDIKGGKELFHSILSIF